MRMNRQPFYISLLLSCAWKTSVMHNMTMRERERELTYNSYICIQLSFFFIFTCQKGSKCEWWMDENYYECFCFFRLFLKFQLRFYDVLPLCYYTQTDTYRFLTHYKTVTAQEGAEMGNQDHLWLLLNHSRTPKKYWPSRLFTHHPVRVWRQLHHPRQSRLLLNEIPRLQVAVFFFLFLPRFVSCLPSTHHCHTKIRPLWWVAVRHCSRIQLIEPLWKLWLMSRYCIKLQLYTYV